MPPRCVIITTSKDNNHHGVNNMARKETIYVVSEATNQIVRKSKSVLAAFEFGATLEVGTFYTCTSEFDLKKGDPMSNIVSFL